ncbi:cAMP-dependent protein kinase catalytic subunit alpha-like [Anthonomus grandis grandis]|uniref:cAMP-dependent protein kinase catalytic subunit alpha-like n=1 Tax=Anthonomus grandis grandis TaxID=2921223 RepID=UPI002165C678|nr:cAMP-dependent protein kinase catalytic subunit alpha-like [Anthonomus grandis grandis]
MVKRKTLKKGNSKGLTPGPMAVDEKLQKHFSYFDQFLRRAKREFEVKYNQEIKQNCTLNDFDILKILGSGSFGMVVLCRDKRNSKTYALKLMEKVNIIKTRQLAHTGAEIKLMKNINFPFIIDMYAFFMDNVYVGICMSFANAGDMFTHLRELKKFEEPLAKFYAAQVILGFEYLHHLGVIYRDLKPENILLDIQGYLKITDLGFCKKIDNTRTYTLCGTPEYLAPEIILSQGYNKSVDYWSYGVLIFEMNAGYAPFFAKDPMRLYEKIVSGKYTCPPAFSKSLKDLLSNILMVDRSKRFGLLKNGVKDIKGHDWFKNTDFDQILSRKVVPAYVPKVDGETDTRYFESNNKPLTVKKASHDEFAKEFEEIFNVPKP